ncbi:methyltransferase domain-containing protein [Chitinophaga pendula]|uniref:methyltransferase domain-containing protein n=1 Tax=Chitinophaga TaxID=79328 RepID=UPI000BAF9475|nr:MULTISPECIES: methyltransferase domain-containing protein [Chitinophaga]ASZ10238.1 transferase [Chitinophaga sp. MD30]UCJ06803.1 methyltransferase domain-containing protein [Chitinophaga pendula]
MYLLIPGRHHLLTDFQFKYLNRLIQRKLAGEVPVQGAPLPAQDITAIIFAVTSANHLGTKRNPVPFYLRSMIIQEFSKYLEVPVYVYGVDDVGVIGDFAEYTIKTIRHASEGLHPLTPDNTVVICSTPVKDMYLQRQYTVLPAEWDVHTQTYNQPMPWDVVKLIANTTEWRQDPQILELMHPASFKIWSLYMLGEKVKHILTDPIIGADGDLTATRDYSVYVRQMDEIAAMKYRETAPFVQPGKIGDIGCAAGSWLKMAGEDARLHECDFYGIEVSRHLYDICLQRKHNGEFANPSVFFSQKNAVTSLVFDPGSMHTIHTSSLTHEITSYGSIADLEAFIRNRYEELAPGGVWINRDVTGPDNKEEVVWLWLNETDGANELPDPAITDTHLLAEALGQLSTRALFRRFAQDFRHAEGYHLQHEWVEMGGTTYCRLSMQDACEFLFKKDYQDNWLSEMHETFCFWNFEDWKQALEATGFHIDARSGSYRNEWIVQNRLVGKTQLFRQQEDGTLVTIDFPVSHLLLLARK